MAPLTRRRLGVLTLLTTAVAVTGCDGDMSVPGLPQVGEDPDHDVVVGAFRAEQVMLDLLGAARDVPRPVRSALAAAATVHRAHRDLLAGEVGDDEAGRGRPPRLPADPAAVLARVVQAERALSRRQADAALAARSGELARMLAALAAAAAQQEHVLATVSVGGRRS